MYFNIMGKVTLGGVPARTSEGVDRAGLLDLIKTKGVRLDSVEILNFLSHPNLDAATLQLKPNVKGKYENFEGLE